MPYLLYGCELGIAVEYPYRVNRLTHVDLELSAHHSRVAGLVPVEVPQDLSKVQQHAGADDLGNGFHVSNERKG